MEILCLLVPTPRVSLDGAEILGIADQIAAVRARSGGAQNALTVVAVLGPGLENAMIAIGVVAIPQYARLIQASTLTVRESDYVQALRALGAKDLRILGTAILPNCMAPLIVQATLSLATAILDAAGLSFLGLGAQPPTPEWGAMLSGGRELILSAPWVLTYPGIAIFITVLAFNLLGDGLRDAFDPRTATTRSDR